MSAIAMPSEKCVAHNHLRGTCPVTGTSNNFCAPQPGDVRSPCPALNTLANHGYLPRNGKHISLPAFARALQAGYRLSAVLAWFLSIGAFILLLQFTPLSLSDIARHNYIEHDASLVHNNTPLEDEYAPSDINHALVDALMADGQDGLMSAAHVGKARVRRENESPALDRLHAEIARGEMAIALRVLAAASAPDAGIPLAWLRTWIREETFPAGWAPSRTVGLMDAVRESGKIRAAMNALVAAQTRRRGASMRSDE
ncbi:Cloroperoxidase [Athelia psychrophila]|uniref:Cloroperoxidase n=1 Tax=Athelia psychrophila TaxID=1759441 RepID=A0A166PJ27_9AGAM|nr:Cloroperoxidase [Fibularhizoctonia sp. CBS 109695]